MSPRHWLIHFLNIETLLSNRGEKNLQNTSFTTAVALMLFVPCAVVKVLWLLYVVISGNRGTENVRFFHWLLQHFTFQDCVQTLAGPPVRPQKHPAHWVSSNSTQYDYVWIATKRFDINWVQHYYLILWPCNFYDYDLLSQVNIPDKIWPQLCSVVKEELI